MPSAIARGSSWAAIAGRAASSHSKRPSSALAVERTESAEAMPEARFAPALLRVRRARPRSTSASSAHVVVLPLVAETSTQPRGSRAARRLGALGASAVRTRPGSVVPPPRPLAREANAVARAAASASLITPGVPSTGRSVWLRTPHRAERASWAGGA